MCVGVCVCVHACVCFVGFSMDRSDLLCAAPCRDGHRKKTHFTDGLIPLNLVSICGLKSKKNGAIKSVSACFHCQQCFYCFLMLFFVDK